MHPNGIKINADSVVCAPTVAVYVETFESYKHGAARRLLALHLTRYQIFVRGPGSARAHARGVGRDYPGTDWPKCLLCVCAPAILYGSLTPSRRCRRCRRLDRVGKHFRPHERYQVHKQAPHSTSQHSAPQHSITAQHTANNSRSHNYG